MVIFTLTETAMPTTTVSHWDDLPVQQAGDVRRILFAGAGADLKRVEVPAGTSAARHQHDHEQFIMVLSGHATLTTSEGSAELVPGSVVRLEAHAWHAAEFHRDTVIVEVNLHG